MEDNSDESLLFLDTPHGENIELDHFFDLAPFKHNESGAQTNTSTNQQSSFTSDKKRKASREKKRREELNTKFVNLANLLEPNNPKREKGSLIDEATRQIKSLRQAEGDLRQERDRLREDNEELRKDKQRSGEVKYIALPGNSGEYGQVLPLSNLISQTLDTNPEEDAKRRPPAA